MTKKDKTYELIVKSLTNEISEEENELLDKEFSHNNLSKAKFERLSAYWNNFFPKPAKHSIIEKTEKKLGFTYHQRSETNYWKWIGITASIILLATLSFTAFNIATTNKNTALNEYWCDAEQVREVTLSDGTKVWLNSSSLLIASEPFIGDKREVTLFGEAYFEVEKDAEKPFIVETANLRTKVLGTHFNIVAYPTAEVHEISLYEGKVQLSSNLTDNSVILLPGDRAYHTTCNGKLSLVHTDLGKPAQWRDGILRFYDEDLFSITKKLERHFLTRIFIADSLVGNLKYSGEFEEETLERILELLNGAKEFEYEKTNGGIIIKTKK